MSPTNFRLTNDLPPVPFFFVAHSLIKHQATLAMVLGYVNGGIGCETASGLELLGLEWSFLVCSLAESGLGTTK